MSDKHPSDPDDKVLEALNAGNRAEALLLHYRSSDENLEDAWKTINELDDSTPFDSHEKDNAFHTVQIYLQGQDPWHVKALFMLAGIVVTVVGGAIMMAKWSGFKTGIESYWWPQIEATILNVRHPEITELRQDREVTNEFLSYRYQYEVNGGTYLKAISKRPFYPVFGEHMYEIGETMNVLYKPDDPAQTIHFRFMYQRAFWFLVGAFITLVGIVFLAALRWIQRGQTRLRRCDPMRT